MLLFGIVAAAHFVLREVAFAIVFSRALNQVPPTLLDDVAAGALTALDLPLVTPLEGGLAVQVLNSVLWGAVLGLGIPAAARWVRRRAGG